MTNMPPARGIQKRPHLALTALWCLGVPFVVIASYSVLGQSATAMTASAVEATIWAGVTTAAIILGLRLAKPQFFSYAPESTSIPTTSGFWILAGITLPIVFLTAQSLVVYVYSTFGSAGFDEFLSQKNEASPWVSAALIVLIAPLYEELIFRGTIYPLLRRRVGIIVSALITAVSFSIMHGNIVQFTATIPLGLFLALVYERTRSVGVVIMGHTLFNLGTFIDPVWLTPLLTIPGLTMIYVIAFVVLITGLYALIRASADNDSATR